MAILKNEERVAGLLLLAVLAILLVHLSANDREFSRYNPGWNGTSAFFSSLDRYQVTGVAEPGGLAGAGPNATLLILAPYRTPTEAELGAYRTFLDRGNTIFLADDFGTGNRILAGLASRITINPGQLASLDREYADPASVVAYGTLAGGTAGETASLILNAPASLDGGIPLFRTSVFSWIDEDQDRHPGRDEVMGIFTVMATEENGGGTLVVLADPSIFINAMAGAGSAENKRLLARLSGEEGPVLIDQMNSRSRDAAGLGEMLHSMKTNVLLEVLAVGIVVLLAALFFRRRTLQVT